MYGVQLYKNNTRALLSRILSILNLDWLQHACSVRGVYEWIFSIMLAKKYAPNYANWVQKYKMSLGKGALMWHLAKNLPPPPPAIKYYGNGDFPSPRKYIIWKRLIKNQMYLNILCFQMMTYGFFLCMDAFLFIFTFLPLRVVLAFWDILTSPCTFR